MQNEIDIQTARPYDSGILRPAITGREMYFLLKRAADVLLAGVLLTVLFPVLV